MKRLRSLPAAGVFLLICLVLPALANAQGPAVTSATLDGASLTVIGDHLAGASTVTVGGVAVGGVAVNPAGTLLTGMLLGSLADGSHLLSITTSGVCSGPAPGADWVCTLAGGWVPPDHPLAPAASMTTLFVVTVGAPGGTIGVPGP